MDTKSPIVVCAAIETLELTKAPIPIKLVMDISNPL